jgi:(p)ppGpp synthase/HD superfamily hydrolase
MPTRLTDRYDSALTWARTLHSEQIRKSTDIPYIAHLLGVSALVLEHGGTEDEAIGGLLHDAVEDQGGAPILDEIRKRYGDAVAAIVEGCTDDAPSRGKAKRPWKQRKQEYIDHLAKETNRSILLVSAADKTFNARAILADYSDHGEKVWDRFNASRDEILWYYSSLVESFGEAEDAINADRDEPDGHLGSLLNRLQEAVEQLHLLIEISDSEEELAELWQDDDESE